MVKKKKDNKKFDKKIITSLKGKFKFTAWLIDEGFENFWKIVVLFILAGFVFSGYSIYSCDGNKIIEHDPVYQKTDKK